jgi:hypothetical protein
MQAHLRFTAPRTHNGAALAQFAPHCRRSRTHRIIRRAALVPNVTRG